jgi:PTS system N-acetylgalactosamine-specific IIA component
MTSNPDAPVAAPAAPIAVVAAHGDLAAGLVSAVAQITGRGDLLLAMTNRGLGPSEIEARLREVLDTCGVRAVFTDLQGGSCTMAARRIQRERPELSVATGVNLATLLDFVCTVDARSAGGSGGPAADGVTAGDVARAVERGRATLATSAPPAAPTAPVAPPAPLTPPARAS